MRPPVVAVVGPTAAGKSDLAVELALRLGGEVVNADSMQLYRGMDIGTAKPTPAERRSVPHHLLDVWEPREEASVATYQRLAVAEVERLRAAGLVPVLVGGSGLYVHAVLDEWEIPGTDPGLRRALERRLAEEGPLPLHRELATVDPAAAAAILPGNGRRIVRALEVATLTGRPFAAALPARPARPDLVVLGVDRPDLDERIAARVDRMWRRGLLDEVRRLADRHGLREGRTASRALGYAQVLRLVDGELDAVAAREQTVQATRRFARRQRRWFRRDRRVRWLDGSTDVASTAAALVRERWPGDPASRGG